MVKTSSLTKGIGEVVTTWIWFFCYIINLLYMPRTVLHADIIGDWNTKSVTINGKVVTFEQFLKDLKADEDEPGEHADLIEECRGVTHFSWGELSKEEAALSLALCFYLNYKWVTCRFFTSELEKAPQGNMHLVYNKKEIINGYISSEALFALEFTDFMGDFGADSEDDFNWRNKN
jgi:hypothetical protein